MTSTRLDHDVVIIGGGLAGSACAIQLARAGVRAAIIEASDFSRFRIGETIEASAGALLRRLGIEPDQHPASAARCSGVSAAWGGPNAAHRSVIFNPYGHGGRVDRRRFDRALFEQARGAGCIVYEQSRVS
jgi:flavin-dependent dehydrogenase